MSERREKQSGLFIHRVCAYRDWETKGGQVNFEAEQIIITTNALPDRWC